MSRQGTHPMTTLKRQVHNGVPQPLDRRLSGLRDAAVRGGVCCRTCRRTGQGRVVAITAGLYLIPFDLLHRLDILRRGWLRGALGDGVRDDLSWPIAGDDRLVVGVAQAGPYRAHAAGYLDRRPDFIALR